MHSIALWPTVIVVAVATFTDLRSRRIPNWLVFPFLLAGILVSGALHGWLGLAHSLEGIALGGLLFGVLSWLGGMGMGDVKLCAAIGAWIGPFAVADCLGHHGNRRGHYGIWLGSQGRIPGRVVQGHGRPDCGVWQARLAPSSRTGAHQPNDAQDALCSRHRDRNHFFLFCTLRTETETMESSPTTCLTQFNRPRSQRKQKGVNF